MSELKQRTFSEIGLFIPPTFKEVKSLWPKAVPLTTGIYQRTIDLMERHHFDLISAYQMIQEEDGQPDHSWS